MGIDILEQNFLNISRFFENLFSNLGLILYLNTRMLVKELKNIEANGILIREVFATVPPTVEYTLTKKGDKLLPSIKSLYQWGQEYAILPSPWQLTNRCSTQPEN